MKKLLASILALTAVTGILASCGTDELADLGNIESSSSESSQADESSDSDEVTEEETTTEETEETTEEAETTTKETETEKPTKAETTESERETTTSETDKTDNKPLDVSSSEADEYVNVIAGIMDSIIDADYDRTMDLSFPASTINAMKDAGMYDFFVDSFSEEMNIDETDGYSYESIEFVSVCNAEPDDYEESQEFYSQMEGISIAMINAGVTYEELLNGDISDEQYSLLNEDPFFCGEGDIIVEFDEYYYVTCIIDDEECEIPVYRQSGSGLKVDLASMGF